MRWFARTDQPTRGTRAKCALQFALNHTCSHTGREILEMDSLTNFACALAERRICGMTRELTYDILYFTLTARSPRSRASLGIPFPCSRFATKNVWRWLACIIVDISAKSGNEVKSSLAWYYVPNETGPWKRNTASRFRARERSWWKKKRNRCRCSFRVCRQIARGLNGSVSRDVIEQRFRTIWRLIPALEVN